MSFLDKLPKNLPFFSKGASNEEYYFALNIDSDQVEAAVWGTRGNKLQIINTVKKSINHFDGPENERAIDNLIEISNYALDEALADFQPEPSKILFGVPDSWLQDDDLKPEYLKILRKMVRELDVTPLAYVSTAQAISHLLQNQQGVPLTAILVKFSDPLVVTVVKAGKNLGSKQKKRSANLPEDVEKILLEYSDIEVLPSKILIYGGSEVEQTEKYKDELQAFSWMSQLPFLHLPKIEYLPLGITIQSICLAGASELYPDTHFQATTPLLVNEPEASSKTKILAEEIAEPKLPAHSERAIRGQEAKLAEEQRIRKEEEPEDGERLEEDVVLKDGYEEDELSGGMSSNLRVPVQQEGYSPAHHQMPPYSTQALTPMGKVKSLVLSPFRFLAREEEQLETTKIGKAFYKRKRIILPILIILILTAAFIFLPKGKVTVFIDLRILEKDSQVTADPKVSVVDDNNKVIPGKIVETTVASSAKASATGKKQVGDPAKGKVILYNKTSAPKTLSQGTVLSGPNNLKFALDSSVQIASQSSTVGADFATITKPGKSDSVGATASSIGPDGNIAAGTEVGVAGFSNDQIVAKVDSAFSGGVSKDVTIVTADDQKKLLAALTSDLRKKAKDEIQAKLTGDQKILEEGLSEEILKKTYSKNVNDQAQEFTLNASARYKGTSFSDSDLKQMVSKLVATTIPSGYQLDLSQTETQAEVAKLEKDGKLVFVAKFRAKLAPKLDLEQIKKDLAFKTPPQAAEKLKAIENVISSNIEITPAIPIPFLLRLPFLPQNITVAVTTK